MKTFSLKNTEVSRDWVLFDASYKILWRFATKIADKLRGKDKPTFTPHVDGGDFVVVINADKVKVTGNKAEQKKYYKHSLYPGGLKEKSYKEVLESTPERIIENAVKGMLPKNKLGKSIIKKLKVYSGSEHPHESQNPSVWNPKIWAVIDFMRQVEGKHLQPEYIFLREKAQ